MIRTNGIDGKTGGGEDGRVGPRLAASGVIGEGRVVAGTATARSEKLASRCCGNRAVATVEVCRLDDKTPVRLGTEHVTGVTEDASDHIGGEPD